MNFLIPVNWVLGFCLFAIALLYPTLDEKFLSGGRKIVAEQIVDRISRFEQRNFQLKERYVFFRPGEMPSAVQDEVGLNGSQVTDFLYEVVPGENRGSFIIRARVSAPLIKSATLPPLTYTYTRDSETNVSQGSWSKLSGKSAGLF